MLLISIKCTEDTERKIRGYGYRVSSKLFNLEFHKMLYIVIFIFIIITTIKHLASPKCILLLSNISQAF